MIPHTLLSLLLLKAGVVTLPAQSPTFRGLYQVFKNSLQHKTWSDWKIYLPCTSLITSY